MRHSHIDYVSFAFYKQCIIVYYNICKVINTKEIQNEKIRNYLWNENRRLC